MRHRTFSRHATLAAASCFAAALLAQGTPQKPSPSQSDPAVIAGGPNPLDQLTPNQRNKYDSAVLLVKGLRFSEAVGNLRPILSQLTPGTPVQVAVAKYTAEAAINAGDREFALSLLKPLETADPNDWRTASMLARVYAEIGQKQLRDSELAHLTDLHKRAVSPEIAKMPHVLLEKVSVSTGQLLIFYSLEPWGRYKTYVYGRLYDQSAKLILRITLESSDFDQKFFSEQHPDLAAKGMRSFSLDGYRDGEKQPNGQATQTHITFKMFDGQPPYDSVREQMVAIAEGEARPMLQSTRPVPQAQ